jgi:hypothetical protein
MMPIVIVIDEEAFENDWVSWHSKLEDFITLCPFNKIEALTSSIPVFPFPHLPSIVERAKTMLVNRSMHELEAATVHMRWMINSYFYQFRNEGKRRYEHLLGYGRLGIVPYIDNKTGFLKFRSRSANKAKEAKEAQEFLLCYPTPSNTSEFTALQNCVEEYVIEVPGFKKAKKQEYFAVLALWLAADCIDRLKTNLDIVFKAEPNNLSSDFTKQGYKYSEKEQDIALAGVQCSEALHAIAYAEKLAANILLEDAASKKFKHAASLAAANKAKIGHKEHYELRDMAVKLFFEIMEDVEKGKRKPLSISAAVKEFLPKIAAHGIAINRPLSPDRGHKTVCGWISKAKKDRSLTL